MKFTTLVSTDQLAQHLNDPQWVVFDCRFTLTDTEAGRRAYERAHIPGARYAHLNDDLSGQITSASGRHPIPDPNVLGQKLANWGVDETKQVVVYDDSFGSMAVRMWWVLRWLGHNAVALLDGGIPVWLREGRDTTTLAPDIQAADFQPKPDNTMWVDSSQVASALKRNAVIIDARSEERFQGDVEPLDKVAGHIPGAINSPFDDNLDLGGTLLSAKELREFYEQLLDGARPDQAIHMCGSGVTACHNLLAMEVAGLTGGKLYVGSWSEWITDPSRPVALGE